MVRSRGAGQVNLCMGSASAKWAFMAPVFISMFMLLGYTPELAQGVYRIGDSSTNLISPIQKSSLLNQPLRRP